MKKTLIRILIALILVAGSGYLLYEAYLALTDQSHIDETFYQMVSDKLVSNVRIVFLSDLHLSEFGEDNCELVARVRDLKPDLILIGGDMNRRQIDDYSVVIKLCEQLVDITDVYYAIGNHEHSRMVTHNRDIYYDVEDTGVIMLNNALEEVHVGENKLYIGGVTLTGSDIDLYSKDIIGRLAAEDGFKLMLAHYPSDFNRISEYDIDLVLSGHLHGGQVNLPYLNGLYSSEDGFFPPYSDGQFERNGTMLIVSRGLGNSSQIPRVNNPPELVIVDITASAASFNTLRLLSSYERRTTLSPEDAKAWDSSGDSGEMLSLMRDMEAKNEEMARAARGTSGEASYTDTP